MTMDPNIESENPKDARGLSLYGYPQCPYCRRVFETIDSLGLEIPLRDTMQEPENQRTVIEAMGRGTVPVLRIEDAAGGVKWLAESADIVRYLNERFADSHADDEGADDSTVRSSVLGWLAKLFRPLPPSH
jgi:glutaredoxin 2